MGNKSTAAKVLPSILFIITGIVIMVNPGFINNACRFLGIVSLAAAVVTCVVVLIQNGDTRNRLRIAYGIVLLGAGIFLLLMPAFFDYVIPVAIGIVCILDGLVRFIETVNYASFMRNIATAIISALLLIIVGVLMIVYNVKIMNTAKWVIGLALTVSGLCSFVNIVMRGKKER